jgi:hypothetical protein
VGIKADPTPGALSGITHPSGVGLAFTYNGHLPTSVAWSGNVNGAINWTYDTFSSIHGAGVTRSASYWASYWRVKCTWWSRASRPTRRPHPGSQQASGSPLNAASSGVRTGARRCVDGTV